MKKKMLIFSSIFIILLNFNGCTNTRYGTRAGVNVTWGPNGPKVRPHIDINLFNGGRL